MYIFLIGITSRVDPAMSVCSYEQISETIRARMLGSGMQILGLPVQRKFVSAECQVIVNTFQIQSRLHTICRKSAVITNTPPNR